MEISKPEKLYLKWFHGSRFVRSLKSIWNSILAWVLGSTCLRILKVGKMGVLWREESVLTAGTFSKGVLTLLNYFASTSSYTDITYKSLPPRHATETQVWLLTQIHARWHQVTMDTIHEQWWQVRPVIWSEICEIVEMSAGFVLWLSIKLRFQSSNYKVHD